ncbi:MAG: phosphate propanoyltransferase [Arachnia sp.]
MHAPDTRQVVEEVTQLVLLKLRGLNDPCRITIGVSNRHVHLSQADLAELFGADEMTVLRPVRQPGEFAAQETVTVHGPRRSFERVRVMGPCRPRSQVELSRTDCVALGIDAPVAQSGHLDDAAAIDIEGPRGRIHLGHAAIVAARHIHLGPSHAHALNVADGDRVRVDFSGTRGGTLDQVIIRVKDQGVPEIHLDTDEANALGLRTGDVARMVRT